jgi:hypothetical protein
MLGLKQSELEHLRENLALKTKESDKNWVLTEILALWACEGKTMARLTNSKIRAFMALKKYKEWKKHSRQVLEHKINHYKKEKARKVF